MFFRDSILLTHISEFSWSNAAIDAAGFLSKKLTVAQLLVASNATLGNGSTINSSIERSKRWPKCKSLGWSLCFPDSVIEFTRSGNMNDPILFSHQVFSTSSSPTRDFYGAIISATTLPGRPYFGPSGQVGFGGVSLQVHNLLKELLYIPNSIPMPEYRLRNGFWQLVDTLYAIAYVQYVNWANGLAHTDNNIASCYLLCNGYESDYVIRVQSWKSVEDNMSIVQQTKAPSGPEYATKNFTWSELQHSNSSAKYGISNVATGTARTNLLRQAQFLQIIRDWHGKPMSVNSGYRSPELNKKVGGVSNSSHMHGLATDVVFSGVSKGIENQFAFANKIASFLHEKGVNFDQIIAYDTFIHLSCANSALKTRNEVFKTNKYRSTVVVYK